MVVYEPIEPDGGKHLYDAYRVDVALSEEHSRNEGTVPCTSRKWTYPIRPRDLKASIASDTAASPPIEETVPRYSWTAHTLEELGCATEIVDGAENSGDATEGGDGGIVRVDSQCDASILRDR